ncbi:TRASH domain-containing protein [Pseudodesulfovibrio indicus]|jgi:YHS domain-containing protein|uniref:TRASH domain-containing protein n=1 Tax=Pseudodesulfovibrio indicus TaxID=1716143 RepID=A0ABM5YVC7_9BACT|nr:TRASH domain-containing protein [Pseudodesulfovibrio indicus]AMK11263.1 hypothetical protein AWY79_09110 [Pseudodesulfovibrio indicus]
MEIMNSLGTAIILMLMTIAVVIGSTDALAARGNQEKCPVMGFEIDRKLFTDYQSKRIYFCCPSCPSDFKKTPDNFMEQMRENGVILEDAPV